jgi:hypothetical protein
MVGSKAPLLANIVMATLAPVFFGNKHTFKKRGGSSSFPHCYKV